MYAAIVVGVVIIGMSIFFVYSSEQAKMRGQSFGKAIEFLQEDLKKQTHLFDSKVSMFKQEHIGKDEFLDFAEKYENEMEKLFCDMIIYKHQTHLCHPWNYSSCQLRHSLRLINMSSSGSEQVTKQHKLDQTLSIINHFNMSRLHY